MSFSKFMDMLTFKRFYFASVAQLREADPLEGILPSMNYVVESGFAELLSHFVNEAMPRALGVGPKAEALRALPFQEPILIRRTVFGDFRLSGDLTIDAILGWQSRWLDVQCWHASSVESTAMWRIYGGPEPSICLCSTVGRLRAGLRPAGTTKIHLSKVAYRQHDADIAPRRHPLAPFLIKSKSYAFERELRAIAHDPDSPIEQERPVSGRYVDVDLQSILAKIMVAPAAPAWFLELVTRLAEPLEIPVGRSEVGKLPQFTNVFNRS